MMARNFVSTNPDFIDVGAHAALDPASITIACWIKWDGVASGNAWVVGLDEGSNRAYAFGLLSGSPAQIRMQVAGAVNIDQTSGTIVSGQWCHIATTGPGADWIHYFNGSSTPSNASTQAIGSSSADCFIGKRNFASFNEPYGGGIADVAIWNTILTSGQILSLYNGMRPGYVQAGNLVGWWPLDGYASPETDLSGSGFSGTLTGTTRIVGPPQLWRLSA